MGLSEKRILATYQGEKFPAWKTKLSEIAGYDLPIEVMWDEIMKEGFADAYPNTIDYNFFSPLEKALQSVASDQIGKDALKAKIKKVKIGSKRPWSGLEVSIDGDALVLDADPTYNRTDGEVGNNTQRISTALESAL
jgi:hypothetical protein